MPHLYDLYRIARWLVRDSHEAEDLVQETLTQALRSFHRYERGTNCRAWMTKIMYNVNGKRLNKLGRMKLVADTEEMIAETVAFVPSIPQQLSDEDVRAALRRIPESFRQIVILADVEEFAYREIADMLQIPAGTVMSRLHRGRKLLRVELAGYAQEQGVRKFGLLGS
ncbi:MAG: sigma-70 family RNA polymerase sigma factor [Blastocatellia bacterium]